MSGLVTFGEGVLRLSPPRGERLETATDLVARAAGSAPATAVAAHRLGADATWVSKLPDSPLGRRVERGPRGTGVETQVVWSDEGRQGTYYVEQAGRPRGVDVYYDLTDSAFAAVDADEFDLDVVRAARGFYVTGITPAVSAAAREATADLLGVARQSGTTVVLDVNYRSKMWSTDRARETLEQLFPAVDVLVVAARDARRVLGYGGEDPPSIAPRVAADYDFTTVVVTRGARGAIAWHDSVVHEHDGYETDTVDPIGAGDAFSGAFVARRLQGDDVPDALDHAAATAALERTVPGDVATVSREEVEAVVEGTADRVDR
ncbi:2-keto-3-deoxygluconate kinase [Halobacteriales archaeon SW_12_71_31]|nr:MAG: 2-keto-3-deoxygluconate kinase [Halobacteriales archaeon SW_12_71_31]